MCRVVRIYCPHCAWKPHPADRWYCACSHAWNTFETGGHCPGCGYAWKVTQCLSCSAMSPHRDWYHETAGASEREGKEQVDTVEHPHVQCKASPLAPN